MIKIENLRAAWWLELIVHRSNEKNTRTTNQVIPRFALPSAVDKSIVLTRKFALITTLES